MRYLFLRGAVPTDRNPREIEHTSLGAEDDMWIHLFSGLVRAKDEGLVVYHGSPQTVAVPYRNNFVVSRYKDTAAISGEWDVVIARGGLPEHDAILSRISAKKTVYYGAGVRFLPKRTYNIVLVDSLRQMAAAQAQGCCAKYVIKPAAPLFRPAPVNKEFDACLAVNLPANKNKRVQWVYDTIPKGIKLLQLGWRPSFAVPDNVRCVRVPRWEMPRNMCRCRVGIVPFGGNDSNPRCISEFMACGLPVVASDTVNTSPYLPPQYTVTDADFWGAVARAAEHPGDPLGYYNQSASIKKAVAHLRGVIHG